MQRKLMAVMIPLAALCLFAPVTVAKADTATTIADDNGAYTVTIPTDVSIDQNSKSTDLTVSAELESYKQLGITIASDNKYQLKCGDKYGLKYTLTDSSEKNIGQITYSTQTGTKQTFSTTLKVTVNESAKVSGIYSDILRFTMNCQECYPEGKAGLSFDANGGVISDDRKVLDIGAEYGDLPEATRTGYTFAGWYTEKDAGQQVTKTDKLTQNTTIYAHWTANTYSVVYDNNVAEHTHASGSMVASTMTYDNKQCLQKSTFTNSDSGALFAGWNTKADGTGTAYTDGAEVLNLVADANGSITLYAQWNYKNIVKVQFEDVNGNYLEQDTQNVIEEMLPAGEEISWSVKDLDAYKENSTQWEKQWQTPENEGTVSYTTGNASKTTIIKIARQLYYLDLNSQWYDSDGTGKSGGGNLLWNDVVTATVKVEINGVVQSAYTAATDYFVKQRYGSTFKFTITMQDGYQFMGVSERKDQPLSNVQVSGNVVTGIVTGERHVVNEDSSVHPVYDATTVALNIQKLSIESTENSLEKQSMDEITVNSDSTITDQNAVQKEESEIETELITKPEDASEVETVPETTTASEAEELTSAETDQLEMESIESTEPDQPITEEETQETTATD